MTVLPHVQKKIGSIKHWQHLKQAVQESIKCKALLSSAMNLDIDPLELTLKSTTIMERVNHPHQYSKYHKHTQRGLQSLNEKMNALLRKKEHNPIPKRRDRFNINAQ